MPRKNSSKPAAPVYDDPDELPPPGAAAGDDLGMGGNDLEPIPFTNRRMAELEATMQSRLKGKPLYPYPPEMNEKLRPYWLELVNSFPRDHFEAADIPLMKLYCRCAHDIERLDKLIEEEGDVVHGARGPIANPRVKIRSASEGVLLTISTKFRAQPASRQNTENYTRDQGKASTARKAGEAIDADEEDLLAGAKRRGGGHDGSYVN